MFTYFDNEKNVILRVPLNGTDFWSLGKFPSSYENPWANQAKNAPFDQKFYVVRSSVLCVFVHLFSSEHCAILGDW